MTKDEKILEWLESHSAYAAHDIYSRWKSGRIMSDGQKRDLDKAIAYAENRPGARPGNTNAQAGEEPASSFLHIRCTRPEKAAWVHAADGKKLAEWVKNTLNAAANGSTPTTAPPA